MTSLPKLSSSYFPEEDACQLTASNSSGGDDLSQHTSHDAVYGSWQHIMHSGAPHVCLLILISFHLVSLLLPAKEGRRYIGMGTKTVLKVFTSVSLALLSILQAVLNNECNLDLSLSQGEDFTNVSHAAIFGMVAILTMLDRGRGSVGKSLPVLAVWSVMLASAVRTVYQLLVAGSDASDGLLVSIEILRLLGVLLGFWLSCLSEEAHSLRSPATTPSSSETEHPEEAANWLSNITLGWTWSMVRVVFQRDLEEGDVPRLASRDRCRRVVPAFERAWKEEEFRCQLINDCRETEKEETFIQQRPESDKASIGDKETRTLNGPSSFAFEKEKKSIAKVILKTFGLKYTAFQFVKTVLDLHELVYPVFTAALMNHINNRDNESVWDGIIIVIAMFVFNGVIELAHHRIWFSITRLSRHMKTCLMMTIFKKSLTLGNDSKKDKTNGELVSIISDDVNRIFDMGNIIFILFMAPLKVFIGFYMLYDYLGWSMMAAVVILPLLIPLNLYIGKKLTTINKHRDDIKDKRVKLMNEIVSGMKVLKLYAWESSFVDKVNGIRGEERNALKSMCKYNAAVDSTFRVIPFLVKACCFGIFIILGGHLDPTKGFVCIALFHTINAPFSLVALLMPGYLEILISLKRINKFLNGEDISADVTKESTDEKSAIRVKDGTFSWEKDSPNPTLKEVNIDIPKGSLVAVVGMVGSGKSSLLSSMLGEMEKTGGEVTVQGSLAYVPQEAWILNATLKENILFGSDLDSQKYQETIQVCSLKRDFKIMAAGDKTEIGEKGINLSGGQKQRVSLARAVYQEADVYLLDDPLSAVDAHVGKHIFKKAISHEGFLKGKTRVLVTHGIHWLPFVDSIIVMKDGQVSETGTYDQLVSCNGTLAQYLRDVSSHSSQDEHSHDTHMKQKLLNRLNSKEGQQHEQKSQEKDQNDVKNNMTVDDSDSDKDSDDCEETSTTESNAKIIDEEELENGAVKKEVYLNYLKSVGVKSVILFSIMFIMTNLAEHSGRFVVKAWTDDPFLANASLSDGVESQPRAWSYFNSFLFSGIVESVFAFLFVCLTMKGGFDAAYRIHNNLLNNIMRCPMSFFDTTPSCRIVTRFSTDTLRIDGLAGCLRGCIERLVNMPVYMLIMVFNAPKILIFLVPLSGVYYLLHRINSSALRQLRRFRSKHNTPKWVHYSETLNGVSSIRAYKCQNRFVQTMEGKIEKWNQFETMENGVGIWFGLCLTLLYLFIQLMTGIIVVMDTKISAGMAGLILMYAGEFSDHLSSLIRIMTHVETEILSLERVLEYSKKPTEAAWEIAETKPGADWPSEGCVVLDNFKVRYREGLDLVLKGVTCNIKRGEKIGIVGRTGAGKSSLTMALFRLVEAASGHVNIDDERISELGLHDLRSKITILPQDPVIFAGSLRMNLDPFDKFTTEELWVALQHSHLKSFVEGLPKQLDFECGEGGKNLSVGQRQLLCLARTLLRQTRILVLDEATAAVDMETDKLIQKTIRDEFKDCTVLSIAHRLNTIMDYDRILVLDQGVVREFDSPSNLLADHQSVFYSMAKDAKLVQ